MRLAVLVAIGACGRVDFEVARDASRDAALVDVGAVPDRVLFLPFDNTLDDPSGRDGTCIGACPTYVTGHDGAGIHFDGTNCVSYPDIAADDTTAFTIAVWADAAALQTGTLVGKTFDGDTGIADSWELWDNDSLGEVAFSTNPGGSGNVYLNTPPPSGGDWHFLVGTYDGTTKKVYEDGVLKAMAQAVPSTFSTDPIRLGCDWDGGAITGEVTGAIDDVSVYTRALSAAEIAALATM